MPFKYTSIQFTPETPTAQPRQVAIPGIQVFGEPILDRHLRHHGLMRTVGIHASGQITAYEQILPAEGSRKPAAIALGSLIKAIAIGQATPEKYAQVTNKIVEDAYFNQMD